MNKLIYQETNIILTTASSFVETQSFIVPSVSGGLLIARISAIGDNRDYEEFPKDSYVSEMICRYEKDDNGTLTLATTSFQYEAAYPNFSPTPSFVNSSNNVKVRFTRNGYEFDSYWMVDMDLYFINN
jgi:hypothetical protein